MSRFKPTHLVCLASAVIGCAVALGFHTASRPPAAGEGSAMARTRAGGGPPAALPGSRPDRITKAGQRADKVHAPSTPASPLPARLQRVGGSPAGQGTVGTESEWFAKAAKVELEANRELCRLQDVLDLSPDQQQRIFGLLARQSEHWAPGMTAGKGAATVADAGLPTDGQLLAELDPTQQEALANEELDRQAWWEEILPQLIAPSLSQNDPNGGSDLPATSTPEVKEFDGSDTLLLE